MTAVAEFALIGDPVAGSASPAMHRAAFRAAGLPYRYKTIRVTRAELGEEFERLRRHMLGLNVTTPLKIEIMPLIGILGEEAVRSGSVNTVSFEGGRSTGHSTDGAGFLAALNAAASEQLTSAVVIGTGGAARAVIVALRDRGVAVGVCSRNPATATSVIAHLGGGVRCVTADEFPAAIGNAQLLVNATPVGGSTHPDRSPIPRGIALRPGLVVFDLVVRPRRTPLLAAAEAAGCRTVEGVEMLIEQGARSFEIWTGRPAPVTEMRRAALDALAGPAEAKA